MGADTRRGAGALVALALSAALLAGAEHLSALGSFTYVTERSPASPLASTFLSTALGASQPSTRAAPIAATANVSIDEGGGYTSRDGDESISVVAYGSGSTRWDRYANGATRRTPFGEETVLVGTAVTEQFLTVERRQGPRTWLWTLSAPGLVPTVRQDGTIEFWKADGPSALLVLPPRILSSSGADISPSTLRWSLDGDGDNWRLALPVDDSNLPLPYVIDPAVFRASSMAGNMGATTLVITKPAGVVQDDVLVASVTVRDNPTITAPAGWNLVRKDPLLPTTLTQAIYYKVAGAAEPANYTWTFSSSQKASGGISAYIGVDTTVPIEASSGASGNGMAMTAPSAVTTTPDATVVAFFGIARSTGIAAPAGMTERYQAQAAGGTAESKTTSESADVLQAVPGPTGNKTATASQGADWVAQLIVLRPKPQARSTSTVLSCPVSTPANAPATCTVTVTDTATGTKTPPAGTVGFTFTSQPSGSSASVTPNPCVLGPATADSSSCTVTLMADTTGSYTILATYSPAPATLHTSSSGSDTITVTARSTSTVLDCPPSTPVNSPASCTVTVSDTASGTKSAPLGTVGFTFDSQPAGSAATMSPNPCTLAPATTSSSTCAVIFLADRSGSYTIAANYSPAPGSPHGGSTGTDTIMVTARTTSTVLDCPPSTAANSPATCTVTVTDTDSGTKSVPTGTVDFAFTSQPSGSTPSMTPDPCVLAPATASSSTCMVAFLGDTPGSYTISADYDPALGSVHAASSGVDTITVIARSTSTVLDCPVSTPANSPANCTVTVTDTDSGTKSAPLGTVGFTFTSQPAGSTASMTPNPCTLAPATTSSSTCTVLFLADTPGGYTIRATYDPAPASIHATSTGTDNITVTARSTSTTLNCPSSTSAGVPATCTVTVTDTDTGTKSPPSGSVSFVFTSQPASSTPVLGPNPCLLAPSGAATSSCTVEFSSTKAGAYTISATYDPAPTSIHLSSSAADTITVLAGPPAIVTVNPPTATNQVNTSHCVTATVTDVFGNPNDGVTVFFAVTGVNTASGTGTTNASGTTEPFCYVGRLFGVDTIRATADANGDGDPDLGEPVGVATKTWTLPPSTAFCDVDFITYGVRIIAMNGDPANGGGNARVDGAGQVTGQHQYQDHGPAQPLMVHSINVLAVVCSDIEGVPGAKQAEIYGEATIDGSGSYPYRIDVEDRGDGGSNDTYWIVVGILYDSGKQTLVGGNVQIH